MNPTGNEPGTVTVFNAGIGNSYAVCSCGWSGSRRMLKAAACQDAWVHAAQNRCDIHRPLVVPVARPNVGDLSQGQSLGPEHDICGQAS
jgi:hypothetical protein